MEAVRAEDMTPSAQSVAQVVDLSTEEAAEERVGAEGHNRTQVGMAAELILDTKLALVAQQEPSAPTAPQERPEPTVAVRAAAAAAAPTPRPTAVVTAVQEASPVVAAEAEARRYPVARPPAATVESEAAARFAS